MSHHDRPEAVGGKVFSPSMLVLLLLAAAAVPVTLYRFLFGIGRVANMTDGFTWGIWEPVNVIVLTGIGAGAYGVGLLCYLLNRGRYHALVRPAVLVGAICYTLGATSVLFALGRYWNSYQLPWIPYWNLSSALLEVALCVLTYVSVLWVEVLPAILEGAAGSASPRWSAFGVKWGAVLFEMALFLAPAVLFLLPRVQRNAGRLFGAALLAVAAGALYRVDTYMTMYRPAGWLSDGTALPAGWDYWPSMGELGVSIGLIAFGIATFIFISRKFPVVVVDRDHAKLGAGSKAAA